MHVANQTESVRLRGRAHECAALDEALNSARWGSSQVLVLRGEAGVGKTALLDYAAGRAHGFRVVRTTGVESEMELAYAGLQQLCAPLLAHLDTLPSPQRDALNTAFGRSGGAAPDRFLVGLATLSLLTAAAEGQPLVCLVDDAQWLDGVSAQTLAFVARRLAAESVAMIFAAREGSEDEVRGLPMLTIRGLDARDARALLDEVILGRIDERMRDRLVAETRGNPLALLELPRDLTAEELAGGFGVPEARPLAGKIEQSFLRRFKALPEQTQRLLLVAAAEPVGDVALLNRAAAYLGIPENALAPAEAVGLLEIGNRVLFRHPLVRSATYRTADSAERRAVHHALAEATDAETDPDRKAWHRASAASGPDEAVATELERSADRARRRGGVAAAGAFLSRATELSLDPFRRATRALAAAQAKREGAALDAACDLLNTAEGAPLDDLQKAQLARLRAQIEFTRSRSGGDATSLTVCAAAARLHDAARKLETLDGARASETYIEAVAAAMYGGRLCAPGAAVEIASSARSAPLRPDPPRTVDLLLQGLAARIIDGHARSLSALRRALVAIRDDAEKGHGDILSWPWQAFPIAQESAAHELWDDDMWFQLADHAVRRARTAGALALLPVALAYRAGVHVHAGELATAAELLAEADTITTSTGLSSVKYHSLTLAAWRGNDNEARRLIAAAAQDGAARGEGRLISLTSYATAVLDNGHGRYEDAFAAAEHGCAYEDLGMFGWCLVELIEAGSRSAQTAAAAKALQLLEQRAAVTRTDWAAGLLARSRALVASSRQAEDFYREAIARLENTRIAVHLARSHLVYGEWLRRGNRRVDARVHLRTARKMFDRMGAEGFADRARRELTGTGEKVRKNPVKSGDGLTAQEAQIARMAGAGMTNPEIAAQLFISSHTVEWHLRKVFAKLGITSRRQLRGAPPAP
nr:LuxR family transcriptional regulator [Mycolicibacter arupensis]